MQPHEFELTSESPRTLVDVVDAMVSARPYYPPPLTHQGILHEAGSQSDRAKFRASLDRMDSRKFKQISGRAGESEGALKFWFQEKPASPTRYHSQRSASQLQH